MPQSATKPILFMFLFDILLPHTIRIKLPPPAAQKRPTSPQMQPKKQLQNQQTPTPKQQQIPPQNQPYQPSKNATFLQHPQPHKTQKRLTAYQRLFKL
jgi:hypothetical protein